MTCVSGAGWGQQVWHHLSCNHKKWKWRSCKRQSAEEGRERGAAEDTRRRSKEEERRRRRNEPTEWEWNVCEESEGVQCLHGFKTPLSLGTRWIQTAPRWNFTGLILEPWRRRTSRRVFFFSRILNWIASLNDSCREIPWTHTPVLEVWWEPVSEVCVRLHVSLQTEEFHELCCTSVCYSECFRDSSLSPTNTPTTSSMTARQTLHTERVAAWSRCMLMNQRSAACFSRVLFMDTNMFRVSVSLITADVLWWSSAGRVFACTIVLSESVSRSGRVFIFSGWVSPWAAAAFAFR